MAQVVQTYRTAATVRGLPPKTILGCISCLRVILRHAGRDLDTASSACLSEATVRAFLDNTRLATKRARTTARSTLHQARALFAKWTRDQHVYVGLHLPDLADFLSAGEIRSHGEATVYAPRPPALIAATKEAAANLPPNLKAVWYLAYGLGLRAKELCEARWDWVGTDGDGRTCLHVINRDDFTLKGVRPRSIPIPANALDHLRRIRQNDYLLPAETRGQRYGLVKWLNAWMRQQGWSFVEYSKGIHELRKLRGCEWFTQINPAYASQMLGHTSIRTTEQYYACYSKGHDALPC
jgi:integrase